jgi:hypothetical protein
MTSPPESDQSLPALFGRPLGNTVHLPLAMAVLWTFAGAAAAAAVTTIVGVVASLTIGVASLIDSDVSAAIPWELLRLVALALVPVAFTAAVWAAAYGSGHDRAGLRTLVGTTAGLTILSVLALLDQPGAILASLAFAWALAMPFEHWARWGLRMVGPVTVAVIVAVMFPSPDAVVVAVIVALSPPVAAATIWLGDLIWLLVARLRTQ